jgi:UPF0755 protein
MKRTMYNYRRKKRTRWLGIPNRVWWLLLVLIILVVGGVVLTRHIYDRDLASVSADQKSQVFTVQSGTSVKGIAQNLQKAQLIRSAWAFQLYVHSKDIAQKLQAGTYAFSPNETTSQIVSILTKGRVSTELVTIYPGERIDQVKAAFINYGYKPSAVTAALNPAQYANLPVMAFKPTNVTTLEGLLWPDSWYKDATSPPSDIISQSLQEMASHLTPTVQAEFASENLTVYQGLTLSSIVIQEVSKPTDQTQAAQVFLSRLKMNMNLGSDVTARYGAIVAGKAPSLTYDSPYNTLLHPGLPPTPISTVGSSALNAVTHPAATNWLYFVAGDDGTTYFSTTLQQQQANTQKYCHKLCSE